MYNLLYDASHAILACSVAELLPTHPAYSAFLLLMEIINLDTGLTQGAMNFAHSNLFNWIPIRFLIYPQ